MEMSHQLINFNFPDIQSLKSCLAVQLLLSIVPYLPLLLQKHPNGSNLREKDKLSGNSL